MVELNPIDVNEDGALVRNIIWFARALRKSGLPVGPGQVIRAVRAVQAAGFSRREDFFWVLHACFVSKREHHTVFVQVFRLFWRDPQYLEHMISMLSPMVRGVNEEHKAAAAAKRAAEALLDQDQFDLPDLEEEQGTELEIDARTTSTSQERLKTLDFEQMSLSEIAEAKRMLAKLTLPVPPIRTRRMAPKVHGRKPDWRATMRSSMRQGGEITTLNHRAPKERWPDLVVICDISGSMSQYSRMVLHFLHAVSNAKGQGWARVHGFTFGTRLTNITRHMATRDVDAALAAAGSQAQDWEGGTRISDCLHDFNRDWSRRVLSRGAVVLLVTDGLERGDIEQLKREMQRLQLSARRLIWINPLLRFDGFMPRAEGIRTMLPFADTLVAGHNVASLEALADVIANAKDAGDKTRLMAMA
ncbi:vWA domain-containing protein [Actibacterium pelagium]|uniref:VWA domain-containing protein n=1 Tax=Actibacterium pelagium TaxID=2029103 RepID=A0A917EIR6_9RHOB|nr:VWA domain-containing protein [Actibacterium pelagium]GGE46031.1 VWA domain-containing protein [Actibacterium pelagium]